MKHLQRSLFLLTLLAFTLSAGVSTSQWVAGGRKQASEVNGNGAILVHKGVMYFWNEQNHLQFTTDYGASWLDPSDSIGGANPHIRTLTAAENRLYGGLNFGTGNGIPIYWDLTNGSFHADTLGAPAHALGWGGFPAVSRIHAWGKNGKGWVFVAWDAPNAFDIKTFDGPFVRNAFMSEGINHPQAVASMGDTLFIASNKFYYTTDGGATFVTPAGNGFSGIGASMQIDGNRIIVFANPVWNQPTALYYSDDRGENWTMVDITAVSKVHGPPQASLVHGNTIFYSGSDAHFNSPPDIWKSTDLGVTWSKDTVGLPTRFVLSATGFAYTPDGNAWAVLSHEEIYKQKIAEGIVVAPKEVATAPAQYAPADGTGLTSNSVDFRWGRVANAIAYNIQISNNADFTEILEDRRILDTVTSLMIAPQNTKHEAYWRVRGLNAEDKPGPWSEGSLFKIELLGVEETLGAAITLSPNPATTQLTVCFSGPSNSNSEIAIFDLLGRQLSRHDVEGAATSATLSVRDLPTGAYLLMHRLADGRREFARFTVQ